MNEHVHELVCLTGKGGVGKSTLAAAMALYAADRGCRPLLVESGSRSSMEVIFESPVKGGPSLVADGIHAMNIEFDVAVEAYIRDQVRVASLAKRIARGKILRRFFRAAPAVAEIAILRALQRLLEHQEFRPIIFDLDATGHALMFFSLPEILEGLWGHGSLGQLMEKSLDLFRDPERSVLHIVSLPAELPVEETKQLINAFRQCRSIHLGHLFINQVRENPLSLKEQELLIDLPDTQRSNMRLAQEQCVRYKRAQAAIGDLRTLGMPVIELPYFSSLKHKADFDALFLMGSQMVDM